jgi:molybdopterin molybdotransferase
MLTVADALARVLARVRPLDAEEVPLAAARGRILARAVTAPRALPPWDASAMDGFAVRADDLAAAPVELPVTGVVAAGHAPDAAQLCAGATLRVMTGAPMPRGADTVVMREEVEDLGTRARFAVPRRAGEHVRRAGEDVAAGAEVLARGQAIGAGEIAMLASLGIARAPVSRRPRVAIVSTGDELCRLGTEPGPGQIVSSNEHALAAQVAEAGGEVIDSALVRDDRAAIEAALARALAGADVVLSSGGVSVGDFDHVKDALAGAGVAIDFWKVAMRPGKPLVFGTAAGGALFFGLPGNPVSSMVSAELFVRPALLALAGASRIERPRAEVVLAAPLVKSPGRAHFVRARLVRRGALLEAVPHARQGSHMLSSLTGVDALIELAAELGDQPAGARLPALLLAPA